MAFQQKKRGKVEMKDIHLTSLANSDSFNDKNRKMNRKKLPINFGNLEAALLR